MGKSPIEARSMMRAEKDESQHVQQSCRGHGQQTKHGQHVSAILPHLQQCFSDLTPIPQQLVQQDKQLIQENCTAAEQQRNSMTSVHKSIRPIRDKLQPAATEDVVPQPSKKPVQTHTLADQTDIRSIAHICTAHVITHLHLLQALSVPPSQ